MLADCGRVLVKFCRVVAGRLKAAVSLTPGLCFLRILLEVCDLKMEPVVGFEPTTDGLQNRCSTTELNWRRRTHYLRAPGRFGKISNRARGENRVTHAVNDLFVSGDDRRQHTAELRA